MKYLTTTLAIACMAFGFASITATPAQANAESCVDGVKTATCINERNAQVNDVESLETQDVAESERILSPGGTAVESDHQFAENDCKDDPYQRHCMSFADREGGSGGDFGESGGGDFGEGDRAAASTAAE